MVSALFSRKKIWSVVTAIQILSVKIVVDKNETDYRWLGKSCASVSSNDTDEDVQCRKINIICDSSKTLLHGSVLNKETEMP